MDTILFFVIYIGAMIFLVWIASLLLDHFVNRI